MENSKKCPVCNRDMHLKVLDSNRYVYDCSTCSHKQFYKSGVRIRRYDEIEENGLKE